MDFLYYGLVILLVVFVSLYFYRKNNNAPVYKTEGSSDSAAKEQDDEETVDLDIEKSNSETEGFDYYKYQIINYWITQKVNPCKNIDYNILKEIIIKKIGKLPDILVDATTCMAEDSEAFLTEVLGRIEYSFQIKYLLVTKSRRLASLFRNLFRFIAIAFFILLQIEIRKEADKYSAVYFIMTVISFAVSFVCKKLADRIFDFMLVRMKPGDYLKMIYSPDENIEKEVRVNQLKYDETMFNKTTIYQSRNQLICEKFIELSSNDLNSVNNKLCLYLVLNYLKTRYSKEAYREYLLEKEIETLEFISAFNPKSVSASFELSMRYFECERFDDFYSGLLNCRNNNGYDWVVEAEIKSYEFYTENCDNKVLGS